MSRYLKLGGITFAILAAGFLLGSGSIGDIIRTWVAGTGASADQAEVEETSQQLANRDVEKMGEALGAERERLSYNSAVRCIVLSNNLADEDAFDVPFSEDDLVRIEASARALAINRLDGEGGAPRVSSDVALSVLSHRSLYHGYTIGVGTDPVRANPANWDQMQRANHDRAVRKMIANSKSLVYPYWGRAGP